MKEKTFSELIDEALYSSNYSVSEMRKTSLKTKDVLKLLRQVREATIEECIVKRDFLIKYINEAVDEMETLGADNIADNIINNLPNYKTDRIKLKDECQ